MSSWSVNPMHKAHSAPRCSATSKRSGLRCLAPAVRHKGVCRMHGARGGAPQGAAHGKYRHGQFTREAVARRQAISELLRWSKAGLLEV